jgi:FtsP/CotA-like multicopper oxidase with cupredoxin domain
MSLAQRLSIAAAGLVAIVLAFVLLQPGGGRDQEQVAAPTPASVTARAPAGTTPATTPTTRAPARPAAPKVQTIRVRGGKPVGGMQDIEVDKGKTVRFRVVADAAEVVHLHGYDIAKPVAPGR